MKRLKIYILLALLLSARGLYAYNFEAICTSGQTLYYNINADGVSVTVTFPCQNGEYEYYYGYDKPTGDLLIPESVDYMGVAYTVTAIGNFAFFKCSNLRVLSLPNTLESIGESAFTSVRFTSHLIIPNSVTFIDTYAFEHAKDFLELTIGTSVDSIGPMPFSSCYDVRTVHFNALHCKDMSYNLIDATCHVTTLTIGEGVTAIPASMFVNTSRFEAHISIPSSVTYIGADAFLYSHIKSLTIEERGGEDIYIGSYAFGFTRQMDSLKIAEGVRNFREGAFISCGAKGHLIMPESVVSVGEIAFMDSQFDTLTLGGSVAQMGPSAFNSTNLKKVYAKPIVPPSIYNNTFRDHNMPIEVPCESLCEYQTSVNWNLFNNIIADFPYHLSVESDNNQMGIATISVEPDCCQSATVEAVPLQGYEFDCWKWDGMVLSREAVYSFDLVEDMDLMAHFKVFDGVEEEVENVSVYPNPATDRVVIEGILPAEVKVYNIHGQLVKTMRDAHEINVAGLVEGFYLLRIMDTNGKNHIVRVAVK